MAAPQSAAFQPAARGEAHRGSGSPLCRALLAPVGFFVVPEVSQLVLGDVLTQSCRWEALDRGSWCHNVDWNSQLG